MKGVMTRAGYTEDICSQEGQWANIRWRGQVASAIRGKRGQAFLRELIDALDALPDKKLISNDLQSGEHVCAIGAVGVKRGVDLTALDPEDHDTLSGVFGIAQQMVREIEYMNDEVFWGTPEGRWANMRAWAVGNLR